MRVSKVSPVNLHRRDDELPDTANVVHMIEREIWIHAGDCSYCGQNGHRDHQCPNRPRRAPGVDPVVSLDASSRQAGVGEPTGTWRLGADLSVG